MNGSVSPEPVDVWPRSAIARGASAVAAPAPASLIVFWGVLVGVFLTQPIRPYSEGAWATGDLILLAMLGGVLGLLNRPIPVVAGASLGLAAAVSLQLFVLAGQAEYQAVVAADRSEPTWAMATAGALVVAFGGIVSGCAVTYTAVTVRRRGRHHPPIAQSAPRSRARHVIAVVAASLAVVSIAGLLVATSLVTAARSAYVPDVREPTINVELLDDGTLRMTPGSVPAGRVTIVALGAPPLDYLTLVGPVPASVVAATDVRAAINATRLGSGFGCCYWNHRLRRADLGESGTYAFVAVDRDWEPPRDPAWDGSEPISDVRFFEVTAAEPRPGLSTEAGGDGGKYLTVSAVAALGIEGWAAAGAVLLTFRRDRRLKARHLGIAITVGLVSATLVGVLAMLAISQAHSPF